MRGTLGVSTVIITRNRKDALWLVLDRLAELRVDETIVVDNGPSLAHGTTIHACMGNTKYLFACTSRDGSDGTRTRDLRLFLFVRRSYKLL
jgi:hypothetical protein